jgi:hypothetical protein
MNWKYTVGEKTFLHRHEAVIESNRINAPIYFHAPQSFEHFDFSSPIQASLDEISSDLAGRLREKYNKIIFWYSGGTDSDYLLDIFLKNKIKIDEIVCLKRGFKDADWEIDNFALPKLKKVQDQLVGTRINVMHPTLRDYEDYYQALDENKIQKGCVNFANWFGLMQQNFYINHHGGENELVLTAHEKPEVVKVGDNYYTYFLDVQIEPHPAVYNFFIDEPLIHSKQSHLWLESIKNGNNNNDTSADDRVRCLYQRQPSDYPNTNKYYFNDPDNSITYKSRKIRYHNTKEKLAVEYSIKNCPHIIDLWLKHLDRVLEITGEKWWNEGTPEMLPIGILSKFYCLNKKDTKTVDELFPNGFKS